MVYVSCDSATLARDLRYLADGGYVMERGRCCDMFPGTVHVETVVELSRKNQGLTGFFVLVLVALPTICLRFLGGRQGCYI